MWIQIAGLVIVLGIVLVVLVATGRLGEWVLGRLRAIPDHLQIRAHKRPGIMMYTLIYNLPRNFQRFTMVYDPSVVSFDAWETEIRYRAYQSPRGPRRQTTKGQPIPGQPNKMELVLASNYTDRLRNSDKRYIMAVHVRFYALNRDSDAAFVNAFTGLRTNAEFRRYLPGNATFRVIRKDTSSRGGWTQEGFSQLRA